MLNRNSISLENSYHIQDKKGIIKYYFNELNEIDILPNDEIVELIKTIRDPNTTPNEVKKIRDIIIKSNLKFVISIAKQYYVNEEILDVINEGNIGLIRAIEKFDISKDITFLSYAVWHIRGRIIDYFRRGQLVNIPENRHRGLRTIDKFISDFMAKNAYEPTDEDILKNFPDLTSEDIKIYRSEYGKKTISLNNTFEPNNEGALVEMLEVVPSNDVTISDKFEEDDHNVSLVTRMLNILTSREKEILIDLMGLYGNEALTLREVSVKQKLTYERTRQLRDQALIKMREDEKLVKLL